MPRNNNNNPRMPIYWELLGFSQEEAKIKAKNRCREGSVRCVEYWIKKGLTLDQAKEEVRKIQDNGKYLVGRVFTEEQKLNHSDAMKKVHNLDHWIEKYGIVLGKQKYEDFKNIQRENAKKSKESRVKNDPNTYINSSIRRPEYWIKKGYSEDEAKLIVSQKQSRSLDFYISKYGEDEGTQRWKQRNEKWYKTFYESGKDLDLVNEKRKLNSHVGYYTKKLVRECDQLNFYLISLVDNDTEIIKYGLTKQDNIAKRWKVSLNYNLILFKTMSAYEAIDLENEFHKAFKNTHSPTTIKTTECFLYNDNNLKEAINLLKKYNIANITEEILNG